MRWNTGWWLAVREAFEEDWIPKIDQLLFRLLFPVVFLLYQVDSGMVVVQSAVLALLAESARLPDYPMALLVSTGSTRAAGSQYYTHSYVLGEVWRRLCSSLD
jgi:hypothetical protein